MIAGGRGDDSRRSLLWTQAHELVGRAAQFEGAGGLQLLELGKCLPVRRRQYIAGARAARGSGTRGVSRTTEYTRFAASRINGSTSLVSIAASFGFSLLRQKSHGLLLSQRMPTRIRARTDGNRLHTLKGTS